MAGQKTPIRVSVQDEDGVGEDIDIRRIKMPIRYWFVLWGPVIFFVSAAAGLNYDTKEEFKSARQANRAYTDTSRAQHERLLHSTTYKSEGGETVNERILDVERRVATAEKDLAVVTAEMRSELKAINSNLNRLLDYAESGAFSK